MPTPSPRFRDRNSGDGGDCTPSSSVIKEERSGKRSQKGCTTLRSFSERSGANVPAARRCLTPVRRGRRLLGGGGGERGGLRAARRTRDPQSRGRRGAPGGPASGLRGLSRESPRRACSPAAPRSPTCEASARFPRRFPRRFPSRLQPRRTAEPHLRGPRPAPPFGPPSRRTALFPCGSAEPNLRAPRLFLGLFRHRCACAAGTFAKVPEAELAVPGSRQLARPQARVARRGLQRQ